MILFQKTIDEIREGMVSRVQGVQEAGYLPKSLNFYRGAFRGLVELWAFGLYQLYLVMDSAISQAIPTLADQEEWVERHLAQVGLTRKAARRAEGRLTIKRESTIGNFVVPSGRVFATLPDADGAVYRFVSSQEEIIPDGNDTKEIHVAAEYEGATYNVAPYTICEMKTHIPGISEIYNNYNWIDVEGTDIEDIGAMKERYALAWKGLGGCNIYAYESWCLSVDGVHTVKVLDNHPRGQGTIDVVVLGNAGLPSEQLINAVAGVVSEKRPINDDVSVYGPVSIPVRIEAVLVITDPSATATTMTIANQAILALFDPLTGLGIGTDVTRDRLVDCMMVNAYVKRIEWISPTWDINGIIPIGNNEIAVLAEQPVLSAMIEDE